MSVRLIIIDILFCQDNAKHLIIYLFVRNISQKSLLLKQTPLSYLNKPLYLSLDPKFKLVQHFQLEVTQSPAKYRFLCK